MNCDGCHGGGGSGWVGPSLIDGRWRYGGADEEIFSSIYFGRPKGMPAYGGVLGADGVWMLVAYLRSLPVPGIVPTTSYEEMDRAAATSTNTSGASAAPATSATAGGTASAVPASAATPEQMLTKYGCVACHAIDRKVVGPSLNDVAAKYRGHPDAANTLIEKVRSGGAGVWGSTPMIPNPQVPDQDLHALVKWVLALQ
jgi:cytochrome c